MKLKAARMFVSLLTACALCSSAASLAEPTETYINPETGKECIEFVGYSKAADDRYVHIDFKNTCDLLLTVRYQDTSESSWHTAFVYGKSSAYGVLSKTSRDHWHWYVTK